VNLRAASWFHESPELEFINIRNAEAGCHVAKIVPFER
jgi:hypothetical protein